MILSRTPIRISLVGGSTDIPNFYRQYGGEVISTAIDKYISVHITRRRNSQIAINTPDHRETVSHLRCRCDKGQDSGSRGRRLLSILGLTQPNGQSPSPCSCPACLPPRLRRSVPLPLLAGG